MPVLYPRFNLDLGDYNVAAVTKIVVKLSRKLPCDTCEIHLPFHKDFSLKEFKENGAAVGSQVSVSLGYSEPEPVIVFTGVVTKVSPEQPLVISCEDFATKLKNIRYTKTYEQGILYGPLKIDESWYSAIAHHAITQAGLAPVVPIYADESQGDYLRESFYVDKHTPAQVLDKLKETGWEYWCVPGTAKIYYGLPWPWARKIAPLKQNRLPVFTFGYASRHQLSLEDTEHLPNIISAERLKFTPGNKIGTVVVYFVDSEFSRAGVTGEYGSGEPVRKFSFEESLDVNAQEKAETRAKELWMQLNSARYEGAIKTFGCPHIKHSQAVKIVDPAHEERSGVYWLDEVTHEYGPGVGFKTTLALCENQGSVS